MSTRMSIEARELYAERRNSDRIRTIQRRCARHEKFERAFNGRTGRTRRIDTGER